MFDWFVSGMKRMKKMRLAPDNHISCQMVHFQPLAAAAKPPNSGPSTIVHQRDLRNAGTSRTWCCKGHHIPEDDSVSPLGWGIHVIDAGAAHGKYGSAEDATEEPKSQERSEVFGESCRNLKAYKEGQCDKVDWLAT